MSRLSLTSSENSLGNTVSFRAPKVDSLANAASFRSSETKTLGILVGFDADSPMNLDRNSPDPQRVGAAKFRE
jgi:hypothetical protein